MNLSYRLAWHFFRAVCRFYFRWRVHYPERVPLSGAVILASNHASFLDPFLVGACVHRRLSYLARDSLFRFPVVKQTLHSWHAVPVDREGGGASGIRVILEALSHQNGVVLFPEGTRTRTGSFLPARPGVGLVVAKSGAPVVPVRLAGTYEAYGPHCLVPRPRRVRVVFGEVMRFDEALAEIARAPKERAKQIYQEISVQIMGRITGLTAGGRAEG